MNTTPGTVNLFDSHAGQASDVAVESAKKELLPKTGSIQAAGPTGSRPFQVTLSRQQRTVEVAADVSLLDALEAAGVIVPSVCREGHCECAVLEGEVEHHDLILGPDERATNRLLMVCVSRAKGEHLVLDL
jgi:ferredoxin